MKNPPLLNSLTGGNQDKDKKQVRIKQILDIDLQFFGIPPLFGGRHAG